MYGHTPLQEYARTGAPDVTITYQNEVRDVGNARLGLSHGYKCRKLECPAPPPRTLELHGVRTVLIFDRDGDREPDWLGEIFEWLSCADEYSIRQRDRYDRVPFSSSYIGRHGLDPLTPYAAAAMQCLEQAIHRTLGGTADVSKDRTFPHGHRVAITHDVDFIPLSRPDSAYRLFKNALISLIVRRSAKEFCNQGIKSAIVFAGGANALDQSINLASREARQRCTASYYILPARLHRKDGNYNLYDAGVIEHLKQIAACGMEIGVHGSYTSLDEPNGLRSEYERLRACGVRVVGGRQHYLRFTLDRLIPALERAGARYDASLGWPHNIGFRGGACFPFPLYNFAEERASTVLELPMVAMDAGATKCQIAELKLLLETSRRFGPGGISVLWHPTAFGGGQVPSQVGDAFWRFLEDSSGYRDRCSSAAEIADRVYLSFAKTGLFQTSDAATKLPA